LVQGVGLGQVHYAELHELAGFHALHFEEVPLGVAFSVGVEVEGQVVFVLTHFDDFLEISPFEVRVED